MHKLVLLAILLESMTHELLFKKNEENPSRFSMRSIRKMYGDRQKRENGLKNKKYHSKFVGYKVNVPKLHSAVSQQPVGV